MSVWDAWTRGDEPAEPGWYAVIGCWDAQEGIFPAAEYWRGSTWETRCSILAYRGPFPGEAAALNWAYAHDPDDDAPPPAPPQP